MWEMGFGVEYDGGVRGSGGRHGVDLGVGVDALEVGGVVVFLLVWSKGVMIAGDSAELLGECGCAVQVRGGANGAALFLLALELLPGRPLGGEVTLEAAKQHLAGHWSPQPRGGERERPE